MAIQYHTEYGLGRRGRVCRSYGGVQAVIAIAFDLALGLVFGSLALAIRAVVWLSRTGYRLTGSLVGLPLRMARAVSAPRARRPAAKPTFAALNDF